jgi:hypothetical protein
MKVAIWPGIHPFRSNPHLPTADGRIWRFISPHLRGAAGVERSLPPQFFRLVRVRTGGAKTVDFGLTSTPLKRLCHRSCLTDLNAAIRDHIDTCAAQAI